MLKKSMDKLQPGESIVVPSREFGDGFSEIVTCISKVDVSYMSQPKVMLSEVAECLSKATNVTITELDVVQFELGPFVFELRVTKVRSAT